MKFAFPSAFRLTCTALAAAVLFQAENTAFSADAGDMPAHAAALSKAMNDGSLADGGPALVMLLSEMATATTKGQGFGDVLRMAMASNGIPEAMRDPVRTSLLENWRIAHDFGLLTPDNLSRMSQGQMPIISAGSFSGKPAAIANEGGISELGMKGARFRLVPAPLQSALNQPAAAVSAAPSAPATPRTQSTLARAETEQKVEFLDIALGESVKLQKYGGGTEEIFVNKADSDQVTFAQVDPAKMTVKRSRTDGSIQRTPNTKSTMVPLKNDPIPGTSEKGTLLTTYNGIAVYFVDASAGQGKIRVAVIYVPGAPHAASDDTAGAP